MTPGDHRQNIHLDRETTFGAKWFCQRNCLQNNVCVDPTSGITMFIFPGMSSQNGFCSERPPAAFSNRELEWWSPSKVQWDLGKCSPHPGLYTCLVFPGSRIIGMVGS